MSHSKFLGELGVSSNATLEEIKSAYRKLSKETHPDLNKSPDASKRFIAITEAYEWLIVNHGKPSPKSKEKAPTPGIREQFYRQLLTANRVNIINHPESIIKYDATINFEVDNSGTINFKINIDAGTVLPYTTFVKSKAFTYEIRIVCL